MAELLLELFSEEIPAGAQERAVEDFKRLFAEKLTSAGISYKSLECYTTPRRVCVAISELPLMQEASQEERRGPRVDAPEKAIDGFLKSTSLTIDQLEKRETPKGEFYFAVIKQEGRKTAIVLTDIINDIIKNYTWAKSMKWGSHEIRWIRPLHSIICLFDGEVLPVSLGHIKAGNKTRGHRFLGNDEFTVKDFISYEEALKAHKVILRSEERKALIEHDAEELAKQKGVKVKEDEALLAEVAGLVEWPVALMGAIEGKFMSVPQEVLILTMRSHQKYFSLLNEDGSLAPYFITISNMIASDNGEQIINGNGRVLRARLEDAKFFWDQDRKRSLESRVAGLNKVVFHAKLGTVLEKVERIEKLASIIAKFVPGAKEDLAVRAASLCKADLATGMVGELPELQGIMGGYYAAHDKENENIVHAVQEHYSPVGSSDITPKNPVSVVVAIADKLDTLLGLFAIGEKPTGSRDPYALRRATLGIIRIVLENNLRISLTQLCQHAYSLYEKKLEKANNPTAELINFFADRLRVLLKDQNIRHDIIEAVFNEGSEDDLTRMVARAEALSNFLGTEDGANLLAAYKRATNIVQIEEKKDGVSYSGSPQESLLKEAPEKKIFAMFNDLSAEIISGLEKEEFESVMQKLATLRKPVDEFFDDVKVNDDDKEIRKNRLLLLSQFRNFLHNVANFSKIESVREMVLQ